jgi:hypothetical protein
LLSHASRPNPAIPNSPDITKAGYRPDGPKSILKQALGRVTTVKLIKEMMPGRLSDLSRQTTSLKTQGSA